MASPHLEWQALLQQRAALHAQAAAVLTDICVLEASRPEVLARHAAAFGARLARLHALDLDTSRLKREIELVQAALYASGELDYETIQATLDAEFTPWQAKLKIEANRLSQQLATPSRLLDREQAWLRQDRLGVLIRRLHPALHPGQSRAAGGLWQRVIAAFKARDLVELDAVEMLSRDVDGLPAPDSLESLAGLIPPLCEQIAQLVRHLAGSRQAWPFDHLSVLDDPAATVARQMDLDDRITAATTLRDERRHWLNLLLDH